MAALMAENPQYVSLGQFENPDNVRAHYETTGVEILRQAFRRRVRGRCRTGGTFSGVSRRLKETNADILCVAVEPANSALLSGREAGAHKIRIGANFIPKNFDPGSAMILRRSAMKEAIREMIAFGRRPASWSESVPAQTLRSPDGMPGIIGSDHRDDRSGRRG
ncbi:MAG: pyridoxal-phosphate dependent enzyme [Merdibacter sp.]